MSLGVPSRRTNISHLEVNGTLADHIGRNWLWLACIRCDHKMRLDPAEMAKGCRRHGTGMLLTWVAMSARCTVCERSDWPSSGAWLFKQRMDVPNAKIEPLTAEPLPPR